MFAINGHGGGRIVSCAPNITEILRAVGVGPELVGVSDFCGGNLPKISGLSIRWEEALSLKPTHILMFTSQAEPSRLGLCERLGIRTLVLSFPDLDSIAANTRRIAAFLELGSRGEEEAESFERRLAAFPRLRPRRVLYILWWNPLVAAGKDTFIGEGLSRLGLTVVPSDRPGFTTLSYEDLPALSPDVILYPDDAGKPPDALSRLIRQPMMEVAGDLWNRPSLEFPKGLEDLAHALKD